MASNSSQMSKSHSISNSVGSSSKAPLLHPLEYERWVDRMEDYLFNIDEDLWRSVTTGPVTVGTAARLGGTETDRTTNTNEELRKSANDRRAKMELRYGLLDYIYTRVQDCKSAKAIWEKLKILYQGTDKRRNGQMQAVISIFGKFTQKEGESLFDCYTRYCIMVDNLRKYGIEKNQMELNVLFLQSLNKEWRQTCAIMRNHEHINDFSLTDLYDLLKNHEDDLDMDGDKTLPGGQLAFVSQSEGRTTTSANRMSGTESVLSEFLSDSILLAYSAILFECFL